MTQTQFFEMTKNKRNQLYCAYYELVMCVPWTVNPDETFLSKKVQDMLLQDKKNNPQEGYSYSLRRFEEFFKVYMNMWNVGEVAKPDPETGDSKWHHDNQYSYFMFLTNKHNADIRLERNHNNGRLNAQFEPAEGLEGTGIEIRPAILDEFDDYEFSNVMNFLPPNTFCGIMDQPAPLDDIRVAFPLQNNWQSLEEVVMIDKSKCFMANPPPAPVAYQNMTDLQKWAVDLVVKKKQKIVYICSKAGCGKTTVALKICNELKGKVQAGASTGKV